MKICSICRIDKILDEFNKHKGRPDGLQSVCRTCNRERSKKYYANNHDLHRANVRKRNIRVRDENRRYITELKDAPCLDCGGKFPPYAMDFDHVRGRKENNVSTIAQWGSRVKIDEELAKCELVCANCHRIRTWNRLNVSEKNGLLFG